MQNNNKVVFLFGSGADTDACDKLGSGAQFSKSLLTNSYKKEIKNLVHWDTFHFQLISPNSTKVFIQTIVNHSEKAENIFGKEIVDHFNKYNEDGSQGIDYNRDIKKECGKFYRYIQNRSEEKEAQFFFEHAIFFDSLDEKFNSLRNERLNSNAKRVINAYWTVFLDMIHSLYKIKDFKWNHENIYDLLKKEYSVTLSDNSYYNMIRQSNLDYSIATTNYTDIIDKQIGKDVIHLHGKLTWFEDLKRLTIYDCTSLGDVDILTKNNENWNIIPFILIPSGVKPLICKKQIELFHKFNEELDKSNYLVVVGYRFNSEDNHINSVIADYLRSSKKKRLILLNYNGDTVLKDMNCFNDFGRKEQDFEKDKKIILDKQIISIKTNRTNSKAALKSILFELEKICTSGLVEGKARDKVGGEREFFGRRCVKDDLVERA